MKAVISVTGRDSMGIIAKVSTACAEYKANIVDISQSVISEYFARIMVADISTLTIPFVEFVDKMAELGASHNLVIHTMHEDFFNSMHTI